MMKMHKILKLPHLDTGDLAIPILMLLETLQACTIMQGFTLTIIIFNMKIPGGSSYYALIEIEGAVSSTNVSNYTYLGEYQGHHYFASNFTDQWWDHANRINNQEFASYGDKAYLYIPNSERRT